MIHLVFYYIGILIVFGTHVWMLFDSSNSNNAHAYINLVASLAIAYYFMNREGIINF